MEFGNFGGVFCQRLDLDSGKKIGVWKFGGGGLFCQRLDLDSGKKIGVWKFGWSWPKVRFGLGEENESLEILGGGVLPKVGFGLGEENWSLEMGGGGVRYQISD